MAAIRAHAPHQAAASASLGGEVCLAIANAREASRNHATIVVFVPRSAIARVLRDTCRSTAVLNVKVALAILVIGTAFVSQMAPVNVNSHTGEGLVISCAQVQVVELMATFAWAREYAMCRVSASVLAFMQAKTALSFRRGSSFVWPSSQLRLL